MKVTFLNTFKSEIFAWFEKKDKNKGKQVLTMFTYQD